MHSKNINSNARSRPFTFHFTRSFSNVFFQTCRAMQDPNHDFFSIPLKKSQALFPNVSSHVKSKSFISHFHLEGNVNIFPIASSDARCKS